MKKWKNWCAMDVTSRWLKFKKVRKGKSLGQPQGTFSMFSEARFRAACWKKIAAQFFSSTIFFVFFFWRSPYGPMCLRHIGPPGLCQKKKTKKIGAPSGGFNKLAYCIWPEWLISLHYGWSRMTSEWLRMTPGWPKMTPGRPGITTGWPRMTQQWLIDWLTGWLIDWLSD